MTFDEFHNGLRMLCNIDYDEMERAGVFNATTREAEWSLFMRNPHRWFIIASDDKAKRVWELMRKRMKP